MDDQLISFILYTIFFYIVFRMGLNFIHKSLQQKNEELKGKLVEIAKQYIFVKPEKHGDMIYLFETDTDRFIAQGRTAQELKTHCQQRFPDKNIVISKEYLSQYAELNDIKS